VYADTLHLAREAGWSYHSTIIWNEGTISRRTAWGSFQSASAPYVITPVETIVVLYRNQWKKQHRGISDITRKEFIDWTNGLWTFSGESKKRIGHPSPYPRELPFRCIRLFTYRGDTVLDPFLGSGTTLLACHQLQRKGIGIDIDENYCGMAAKRLRIEMGNGI
ncbi:MAG: site-specific DNA-methyltransferase, partial [Methanomicrobiales archaeon]|nr:site-specific DNA-methyltransferase [Methanomicrobiales archaeon]